MNEMNKLYDESWRPYWWYYMLLGICLLIATVCGIALQGEL